MKRLLIILGLGLTIGMANVKTVEAQIVNVYVNIDFQPAWGPAGYDYAAFYYFPTLNIYYDVNQALFYYLYRRNWVSSYYLPVRFQNYDFYSLYKVVINDYHSPWLHNGLHRSSYAHFRNVRTQHPIRFMAADHRYHRARMNTRAWVEPRQVINRQSGSITRNTPAPRNNYIAPRQPVAPRRDIRTPNNNQSVRSQTTPRHNQNPSVTPRQNTPENRPAPSLQRDLRRSQDSKEVISNRSATRSNQNKTVTRSSRTENSRVTINRSNRQNNNTPSTRSSESTRSSRSGRG
ncbi:MAG: hypothetical protein LBE79_06710 [Tannerella sp.]|jgi:hypothetical protein|nr:hypothetical protein [Tannerella sp.]